MIRGPPSSGRRVTPTKLAVPFPHVGEATAHRSMPKGLKGLRCDTLMESAMPPVPATGPTKIGSGAAWLVEERVLKSPLAYNWTSSLASYVRPVHSALRCEGVSSRL